MSLTQKVLLYGYSLFGLCLFLLDIQRLAAHQSYSGYEGIFILPIQFVINVLLVLISATDFFKFKNNSFNKFNNLFLILCGLSFFLVPYIMSNFNYKILVFDPFLLQIYITSSASFISIILGSYFREITK